MLEIEGIFLNVAQENSYSISFPEFLTAGIDRKEFINSSNLKSMFKITDGSEYGFIKLNNLKNIFVKYHIEDEIWDWLFQESESKKKIHK